MKTQARKFRYVHLLKLTGMLGIPLAAAAQQPVEQPTSYAPVRITESFARIRDRMADGKDAIVDRQRAVLESAMT